MCECIKKANEALAAHNTAIDTRLSMNMKTGIEKQVICVPTRKIKSRGKPMMNVIARFCPLCGEKQ